MSVSLYVLPSARNVRLDRALQVAAEARVWSDKIERCQALPGVGPLHLRAMGDCLIDVSDDAALANRNLSSGPQHGEVSPQAKR